MTASPGTKPSLVIRVATRADIPGIVALSARTYGGDYSYLPEMVGGQLAQFPEGQFVAVHEGTVVGYCATFRIAEDVALRRHSWREITG
ncbi:MAG TPA: carbon-nitrogen hydrolase, partial [Dokdonella sp.]